MGKRLFIAEKPSVAQEFAKALHENFSRRDGFQESENSVVTWCVGHLVTMSYPEAYDPEMAKWKFETLPFLPKQYKYEIIPSVKKQFDIVKGLLCREDVDCIYICTDSGREGEYIYRLVDMMAQVPAEKVRKRVWIDSQTEEEIKRGIETAKTWDAYDNLSEAAFLRAKEDYLMGINFSRALSIKYGYNVRNFMKLDKMGAIAVGRVMTCVLGMVVRREREIRDFKETNFYRVVLKTEAGFEAEFRAVEGSRYFNTPFMYKENGFKEKKTAEELMESLKGLQATVASIEKKEEKKNPPLLYNLAEAQNDCSRLFKISPDETLKVIQNLYEKKLVTYPRTDARVLSTAVSKEIAKNISGLKSFEPLAGFANEILEGKKYVGLAKTRYVDDKKITDHYAIIPTGQGIGGLRQLPLMEQKVYELIARRFLSIFYPPAVYSKDSIVLKVGDESFFANFKALKDEGYFKVSNVKKKDDGKQEENGDDKKKDDEADSEISTEQLAGINKLKKGDVLNVQNMEIKEGKTSPPKRYTSGSLILAMENAGQFIEDEELRAQIKGSGIGTSATRAEILNKLVKIQYLNLNKKTQIFSPTKLGEIIHEVVTGSISSLLRADLTASWEKGLTQVAEGQITGREYMEKLEGYVTRMTDRVKNSNINSALSNAFISVERNYK
ncbi:MAG: type IA DNA topoisomerase [Lachnospiraceae bacterium]|nr:type IA DNA topoisomerase [Lachnospiraceae bacterium]